MGTLRVLAVDPDPSAAFVPKDLPDGAEVVGWYRMTVATETRQVVERFCVFHRGSEAMSARPEYSQAWLSLLLDLGGSHRFARWGLVLGSVVESIHRGVELRLLAEFTYHAPPEVVFDPLPVAHP